MKLPVWRGTDRVCDLNLRRNRIVYVGAVIVGVVTVILFALGLGDVAAQALTRAWPGGDDRHFLFGVVLIVPDVWLRVAVTGGLIVASPIAAFYVMRAEEIDIPPFPMGFFCREWKLMAGEGEKALSYQATDFSPSLDETGVEWGYWSVSLDDIARVESGRTAEWIPRRVMPGGPFWASNQEGDGVFLGGGQVAVPPSEYQAFLFLNDGSRRVICTLHNGREETAKLAASVRAWVEAQRAAASEQSVRAVPSMERCEGFDI